MVLLRVVLMLIMFGWRLHVGVVVISIMAYGALKCKIKHPFAGRRAILLFTILFSASLIFTLLGLPPRGLSM